MKLCFLTGQAGVSLVPRPVQGDRKAEAAQPVAKEIPSPAAQVRNDKEVQGETKESVPGPERRRRTPKTGSSLSMNALMGEKEEKPAETETGQPAAQAPLPSDDEIRLRWKDLSLKYASRPRLANALAQAGLRMVEEDGVKSVYFSVSNAAQKQWIEEKLLRELENSFREMVSSVKVNLHVDDLPEEEPGEKKPYMPEEKAKDLMDRNPDVRALVADFGLDTK
jgi:hypothetical protein